MEGKWPDWFIVSWAIAMVDSITHLPFFVIIKSCEIVILSYLVWLELLEPSSFLFMLYYMNNDTMDLNKQSAVSRLDMICNTRPTILLLLMHRFITLGTILQVHGLFVTLWGHRSALSNHVHKSKYHAVNLLCYSHTTFSLPSYHSLIAGAFIPKLTWVCHGG